MSILFVKCSFYIYSLIYVALIFHLPFQLYQFILCRGSCAETGSLRQAGSTVNPIPTFTYSFIAYSFDLIKESQNTISMLHGLKFTDYVQNYTMN